MTIEQQAREHVGCYRAHCIASAEWQATIRVDVDGEQEPRGEIETDFKTCTYHRDLTPLDFFLTPDDKRALTEQLTQHGGPPPDWDTAALEWKRL